ncbi:MAG: hypothetical protein KDK37_17990 [Leptospiraceae bacterium]|nr:hypothetical protein [Leptospiraceae bacterium]
MSAESVQQRKYVWGVDDLPAGLRVDDYVEEAHQIWMQLIQTVNESNPGNRYFWYSVFSSRDPFACSLLLDLSILLAILDNRSTFQDVLVSIPGQAEPFLFQTLHRLGIQVKVQSNEPGPQVSSLRKKWQDWRSFLQNVWLPLIKQKASAPPKPVFKSDPVWLFDTFVSLDNAGELQKDRYFTTIVSEDTIPRHSYFTYSPLHSDTRRLRSVLSKDWRKWLHKESFLSWADYLRALTIPRKLSGIRVPAIILTESELDFSPLVQSMLVRYRFDDMSVY